jgi:putative transposase
MTTQRRRYSAEFKARMAFEALKGRKLSTARQRIWGSSDADRAVEKSLQTEGPRLLAARSGKREQADEALKAQLYQQIGQLKVEWDWLKKSWT